MSDNLNANSTGNANGNNAAQGCIAIYAILSLIISILVAFQGKLDDPGFFSRTALVVVAIITGTPCGTIGGMIGDVLRRIACPDMIFTRNSMGDILKTKLFWSVGPQLIGVLVGSLIGASVPVGLLVSQVFNK